MVFKRKTNAVRRREYKQLAMAIFALLTGKVDYEVMSNETGSNGRMAQPGRGHRINWRRELLRRSVTSQISLSSGPPAFDLLTSEPNPVLVFFLSRWRAYTRINHAETGAPLAALIAAAYIPTCRR